MSCVADPTDDDDNDDSDDSDDSDDDDGDDDDDDYDDGDDHDDLNKDPPPVDFDACKNDRQWVRFQARGTSSIPGLVIST